MDTFEAAKTPSTREYHYENHRLQFNKITFFIWIFLKSIEMEIEEENWKTWFHLNWKHPTNMNDNLEQNHFDLTSNTICRLYTAHGTRHLTKSIINYYLFYWNQFEMHLPGHFRRPYHLHHQTIYYYYQFKLKISCPIEFQSTVWGLESLETYLKLTFINSTYCQNNWAICGTSKLLLILYFIEIYFAPKWITKYSFFIFLFSFLF